ncbi:MerR family transcriptional regulator [Cryobacterium soli]|uniref:MerR family transcriptional regulator n=1 Tax=Cryobacterium soli TaxID=2220095 RepID=UPI000E709868|nr:MerR family transcriptional regulator [Cryobacterium soli]
MTTMMTIGDFSRATRLSAKTLRFYHRVGLLAPAQVDPGNGYRMYSAGQIADAQVIRHFRSLDMPVQLIGEVLAAPGIEQRNELIAGHLGRLQDQLEQTRAAVAGLQGLLAASTTPLAVSHRSVPEMPALVISETIDLADLGRFYTAASRELARLLQSTALSATGSRGGIWSTELFLDERGEAILFVPVTSLDEPAEPLGRARLELLPAVDLAVATHHGTDDTIAQVYGALGEYVTARELGIDGPIRETYLDETADGVATTEIGWPIFRTGR